MHSRVRRSPDATLNRTSLTTKPQGPEMPKPTIMQLAPNSCFFSIFCAASLLSNEAPRANTSVVSYAHRHAGFESVQHHQYKQYQFRVLLRIAVQPPSPQLSAQGLRFRFVRSATSPGRIDWLPLYIYDHSHPLMKCELPARLVRKRRTSLATGGATTFQHQSRGRSSLNRRPSHTIASQEAWITDNWSAPYAWVSASSIAFKPCAWWVQARGGAGRQPAARRRRAPPSSPGARAPCF